MHLQHKQEAQVILIMVGCMVLNKTQIS